MIMFKTRIVMENIPMLWTSSSNSSTLYFMLPNNCFNFGCGPPNILDISWYNVNNDKYAHTPI